MLASLSTKSKAKFVPLGTDWRCLNELKKAMQG
jgi:hypothetical protein